MDHSSLSNKASHSVTAACRRTSAGASSPRVTRDICDVEGVKGGGLALMHQACVAGEEFSDLKGEGVCFDASAPAEPALGDGGS